MATARERVQALDDRLRELEERFESSFQAPPLVLQGRDVTSLSRVALQLGGDEGYHRNAPFPEPPSQPQPGPSVGDYLDLTPDLASNTSLSAGLASLGRHPPWSTVGPVAATSPHRTPREETTNIGDTKKEVPLRLYHQGLPHRDLGPPQSTWEADKNAAVIALANRVQQLENDIRQQQQQEGELQQQQQDRETEPQALPVEPHLAATDRLPLPRNTLGSTARVVDMAALYGVDVGGPPPVPVTYYTPRGPSPTQTRAAQPALGRLMTAQETRSQTRVFAASVAASAASTVPSIMMRRMPNENAQPCRSEESDVRRTDGGGRCVTSSVGVSAPLGHARTAAIAAASAHVATLHEAAPLQAAGPYPMVAAALAVGAPGTGSSTWEQSKMRALLSLEQQRDALRAQLEEFRELEKRNQREMAELREKHRREMQDAAGNTGRRLERLMGSAWRAYSRRLRALRTSRLMHAWRRIAARNRRLVWAAAVWRQRALGAVLTEWNMCILTLRCERQGRNRARKHYLRNVLMAWAAVVRECQRIRRLHCRVTQARMSRLLMAWGKRTKQLRAKRRRCHGAEKHRRVVLLRNGWRGLALALARCCEAEAVLKRRLTKMALVMAFKIWCAQTRLGRHLDAMHRRATLRVTLRSWAALAITSCLRQRKLQLLGFARRRRRIAELLAAWAAAARRSALLHAAGRALATAIRHNLQGHVLTALRLAPRERMWTRRRGVLALRAWCSLARRAHRNQRLLTTRHLATNRTSLAAMFDAWRVLGKARSVRLHLREIHRLQELEPMYEHQMELVRQDRTAAQSHSRAVMEELKLTRVEMLRGFVTSSEGGLLNAPLRWRSLPPSHGQWLPPPRCRHSTFCLRALQQPHTPPPTSSSDADSSSNSSSTAIVPVPAADYAVRPAAGAGLAREVQLGNAATATTVYQGPHSSKVEAVIPNVAGLLVVFGGVNEEEWYRDLHVLELSYAEDGIVTYQWHPVEVALQAHPATGVEAGSLRGACPDGTTTAAAASGIVVSSGGKLPLPTRRDHAACVTDANQFMVVGGFDGTSELMDIHAVTVRATESGVGWVASVRAVIPRNRAPPGRSHHTVTCHTSGRSLYVFGGYASASGTLGDLWVFHLDHQEWWQPNTTGDQPPPRRNHVAALLGGRLVVHGGFNGWKCLGDTWMLDPQTWRWEQLAASGLPPSPRRGHTAEVVMDRYLLVHGGYDGVRELADGYVLDITTGAWRDLAAAGGPEDMPSARAYHTLTLVGHVMVALGGNGTMGQLLDVHLLESPPLVAGLAQQHQLLVTAAQLSATRTALADTEAALAVTRHRAELSEQQLQMLRKGSSELLLRHNATLADQDRLAARLAAEAARVVAAEAAAAEAQLALATAQRRLRRTREGGKEVVAAARDMHDTVCALREEVAHHRSQLVATTQQHAREAAQTSASSAERQLLQQQLAGAQQETALLRGMLATAEVEFRTALDRQRSAAEAELAAAAERAKQLAVAAAAAAGGAAAAGAAVEMDLVVLHQLATATTRAETADIRLHAMEREYGGLQADIANVQRQLHHQRQAREAAEERATAAIQHMHASELRYQMQVEDLQRLLAEAQRERWRQELQLLPPRKRAALQTNELLVESTAPLQPPLPAMGSPTVPAHDTSQEGTGGGKGESGESALEEAERLLRSARPPPQVLEMPARRTVMAARASVVLDPTDPSAHYTVQHLEKLELEDPVLEMLPEVARLMQLQRRLFGQA